MFIIYFIRKRPYPIRLTRHTLNRPWNFTAVEFFSYKVRKNKNDKISLGIKTFLLKKN